ncbi:helicase associated domain-containing protein, partial [Streptomyces sp. NPDC005091]
RVLPRRRHRLGSSHETHLTCCHHSPHLGGTSKWALHLTAARQFYKREGHLQVPRKHVETITISGRNDGDGEGQEQRETRLGAWVSNQRLTRRHALPRAGRVALHHGHALDVRA